MRRHPSAVLSTLSLVALAVVLVLWAASYHRYRLFSHEGRALVLAVEEDRLTNAWLRDKPPTAMDWQALLPPGRARTGGLDFVPPTTLASHWYTYASGGRDITTTVTLRYWLLAVPYWVLAVPLAALPLARLWVAVRRRRRGRAGTCAACGYDLRATPEPGGALLERCPECGATAAVTAVARGAA